MGMKGRLISDLNNREVKAFEVLFFKYHGRLVLFALKFTNDLPVAKDIVQDVFLSLWEKSGEIKVSPKAYLFQAVKNNALNYLRHLKIDPGVQLEAEYKIAAAERMEYFTFNDPYHSLIELELEQKIENVINSLPKKCLIVYNLSRKEHLKNKEIAEKLGISLKAVEKHISKALSVLRHELSEFIGLLLPVFLLIQ